MRSILVTDTIPVSDEIRRRLPCLQVVPSVAHAAEVVHRLNAEEPLSALLAPFDAQAYLDDRSAAAPPRAQRTR